MDGIQSLDIHQDWIAARPAGARNDSAAVIANGVKQSSETDTILIVEAFGRASDVLAAEIIDWTLREAGQRE
jgi:hypothetical protein